jgi:hypothetical protein
MEELQDVLIDHRPLRIEWAKVNRTLTILSLEALDPDSLNEWFGAFGQLESVILDDSIPPVDYAYLPYIPFMALIKFKFREDAVAAYWASESYYNWVVLWDDDVKSKTVETGRLGKNITTKTLDSMFSIYGNIANIKIKKHRKESIAIIEYASAKSAMIASLTNCLKWLGKKNVLFVSAPNTDSILLPSL